MLAPVAQAVTPHLKDEEEEEKEEEEEEQHQILSLVSDTMAACLPTSYCDRQPPYSDFDLVNTVTHEFKKFCDSKASDMLMKDGVRISRRGLM